MALFIPAHGDNAPSGEVDDPVRHFRYGHVMGYDHGQGPQVPVHPVNGFKYCYARLHIEGTRRFVAEKDLGPLRYRPCDSDPLLLPSGKLGREMIHSVFKTDKSQASPEGMGSGAISEARSTFSRAVKLGITL